MSKQREEFIKRFKSTFVYDLLSESLTDEQLFEHAIDFDGDIIWMKEQTRQMWSMWQQAQKVAVPEGSVVVPKEPKMVALIKMRKSVYLGDDENGAAVHLSIEECKTAYKAVIEAQEN